MATEVKKHILPLPPLSTQKKYCVTQIHCENFQPFQQWCFSHPKSFPNIGMTETPKFLPPYLTHRTCGLERNKNTHSCGGTWWMHLVHQPVDKTLSCIRLIMKTDILDKHIVVIKVPWGLQLNLQFLSKHSFTALGSLEVFGMSRPSTSC